MGASPDLLLSEADLAFLQRYRFDGDTLAGLRADLKAGAFEPERNRLTVPVAPPALDDVLPWPQNSSEARDTCEELGRRALRASEVGVVILNGGMATRFGGVVKGAVEVFDGHSFLGLKLANVRAAGDRVTAFLMNSFATDEATLDLLRERQWFGLPEASVACVTQGISVRLTPDGELFREAGGGASFYAPGHGDLFESVARSDAFARFVENGGKYLLVSNVDNLGATLEPAVIGAHIHAGRAVTVEVAQRNPGDAGGAPARVGDRVAIVEGFRFPAGFDFETLKVFNTNTMVVSAEVMAQSHPLTWFRADKTVDGRAAVQFERLMGEVTSFVDAAYLQVPREGPEGRFMPIKKPEDLVSLRPVIRDRLSGATP